MADVLGGSRSRLAVAVPLLCALASTLLAAQAPPEGAMVPVSTDEEIAARVLPRPQYVRGSGLSVTLGSDWRITLDASDEAFAFAGEWLNQHLEDRAPGPLAIEADGSATASPRRIVIGNPDAHEPVREALRRRSRWLPESIGPEGYVLAVYGGDTAEVIIAAHAPNGAFYGVVTLLQLLGPDGSLPEALVVDYPEHGLRGTYEPDSSVMGMQAGRNVFTDRQRAFIDWLAERKFNALFLVDNADFFQEESTWLEAYQELFAYARQRFIEPVPRVCSISTVGPFPFEFFEGWSIENEPFAFDSAGVAVAERPFVDEAPNGDFERDDDGDGLPDGWTANSRPGATWSLDDERSASGTRSMRLDIPAPTTDSSSATLSFTLRNPRPDSHYCLWSRARAQDIGAVPAQLTMYAVNAARQTAVLQSDVMESTDGWVPFGVCIRTPADPIALTVYSRIQSSGSGTFWIDDVRLARVDGALRNVIRAADTDIVVTDASGLRRYEPSRDYEVTNGATNMRFAPDQAPFVVRRLPDGGIAAGERVLLSYDAYLFSRLSMYWSSAPCLAHEPLYSDYYEPAIDRIVTDLHPKFVNIDADEIRGFYRDSRMLRRFGSNAEAIAYWANRIQRMLAERDPSARLWIWDDMVSPFHNGGVADYQVHYGGRPGRMAEATEREWIDKSVIMDVWWYSDDWLSQMWGATEYFGDKGYDVLGSPWLDPGNIVSWSEMLVDREHALGGVETNWGTPHRDAHETFADHFWNTRYSLALFDSFETDADGDGVPDGWSVDGRIEYSTDGSASHGRRLAGFPAGAVGVLTSTVGLRRSGIEVRPDTPCVLTAYLRRQADADPRPSVEVSWFDRAGSPIGVSAGSLGELGTSYAEVSLPLRSPRDAASASIAFDATAAEAWLDVLRFKQETGLRAGVATATIFLPTAVGP